DLERDVFDAERDDELLLVEDDAIEVERRRYAKGRAHRVEDRARPETGRHRIDLEFTDLARLLGLVGKPTKSFQGPADAKPERVADGAGDLVGMVSKVVASGFDCSLSVRHEARG